MRLHLTDEQTMALIAYAAAIGPATVAPASPIELAAKCRAWRDMLNTRLPVGTALADVRAVLDDYYATAVERPIQVGDIIARCRARRPQTEAEAIRAAQAIGIAECEHGEPKGPTACALCRRHHDAITTGSEEQIDPRLQGVVHSIGQSTERTAR